MLIQRITDEAVPGDVREAEAVVHYPADIDPVTGQPYAPDAEPQNAAAGMKTATTAGVVRIGALMAVATVVSRVTGLVARLLLAAALGFGVLNDSYNIANTMPNVIYELILGGVLTSVFIPVLVEREVVEHFRAPAQRSRTS